MILHVHWCLVRALGALVAPAVTCGSEINKCVYLFVSLFFGHDFYER